MEKIGKSASSVKLEDFEKALMWKTAKSSGATWDIELGLEATAKKVFVGVYSKPALRLSPKRQDYDWSALHFVLRKSGKTALLDVELDPEDVWGYLDSLSEYDMRRALGVIPAQDFSFLGETLKRKVLAAVWKAAGTGCLELPYCGKLPLPEQMVLEWSMANG